MTEVSGNPSPSRPPSGLWPVRLLVLASLAATALMALVITLLAFVAKWLGADRGGVEWVAAIGQWVSGAATLATVWVALHQILEGKRERQTALRRQQLLDRTLVSLWGLAVQQGATARWDVTIRNQMATQLSRWQLGWHKRSSEFELVQQSTGDSPIPPGETRLSIDSRSTYSLRDLLLVFEDSTGNWWSRNPTGHLTPLDTVQLGELELRSPESVTARKALLDPAS